MLDTDETRGTPWQLVVSVAAMLVVAGILWLLVGVEGILIAGVVSLVWSVARPPYAVAVGGVLYVVLLASADQYAALAAASLAAVFAADAVVNWPERTAGIALFVLLTTVAVLSEAARVDRTWQGALAMLAGFALAVYVVHRYELVRLGMVGGTET